MLTESGEELLPYARKTLHTADSCVEHIRDIKNVVTGSLNIGVTYTFSPILTETLLSFMKLYPNVKLNIFYKTMEELMAMLDKRDLDFVLAFKLRGRRNMRAYRHTSFSTTIWWQSCRRAIRWQRGRR